mmetsp:Transcript_52/g.201  ORF Transcript_52/g.201 Transcript_52/m.201 type:complete len:210 (+) Transcript_52:706-1335(+)
MKLVRVGEETNYSKRDDGTLGDELFAHRSSIDNEKRVCRPVENMSYDRPPGDGVECNEVAMKAEVGLRGKGSVQAHGRAVECSIAHGHAEARLAHELLVEHEIKSRAQDEADRGKDAQCAHPHDRKAQEARAPDEEHHCETLVILETCAQQELGEECRSEDLEVAKCLEDRGLHFLEHIELEVLHHCVYHSHKDELRHLHRRKGHANTR